MADADEIWIPLVDEPIGTIVQDIQDGDPEIARLVDTPHRVLAFKTFAYIRVGVLLGQLLVENDVDPDGRRHLGRAAARGSREPPQGRAGGTQGRRGDRGRPEVRDDETLGPDDAARERFRDFARRRLTGA